MIEHKIKRTIFILFAFIGSVGTMFLMDPSAPYWYDYFQRSVGNIALDYLTTLAYCVMISEVTVFVDKKFNKLLPWNKNPLKRLLIQTFVQILSVLVINILLFIILDNTMDLKTEEYSHEIIKAYWGWVIGSILITLMIGTINAGSYLISNWKKVETEIAEHKIKSAQHKQAAAEAELHALKLQLDNHFVFNNLSVLSELILKDQKLGFKYAENFAKVYRYLLVNSKINLISLKEELRFLDAYLFLIKNRLGEGVVFKINIEDSKLHMRIPPITVQLLIENALKHNQTSSESPLAIRVFTNGSNELVVQNSIIPLMNKPDSAGIGLNNIISRYNLISEVQPEVKQTQHLFIVKVPLI
ncbi:MAG: histidine kinase [Sphingobacterium sp.]|jgi:sensor histidine kinase YesM|nr:histidine kinase [Sphingobacterium sp.]